MALIINQGKRGVLQVELAFLNKINKNLIRKYDNDVDSSIDQSMSIYISKISSNTHANTIAKQFRYNNIGIIERVDIVNQTYTIEPGIKSAFIHFAVWFDTPESRFMQNSIRNEGFVNINYDSHITWFTRINHTTERIKKEPIPAYINMSISQLEYRIGFMKTVNAELEKQINREDGEVNE